MNITIRDAIPTEADTLTDIAVQAKGYWGYSAEQLAIWKKEFLTITSDYIENNSVWCAVIDQQVIAFAAIEQTDEGAMLEHLWVSPDAIGKGVGKRLFLHVASHFPEFVFTSDPHADTFYRKMGAEQIGVYQSGTQGRTLTKFRYRVVGL